MTRPERTSMQRIPPPIAPAPVSDPAGITAAFAAANGLPSPIASGRALPDPIVRPGSAAVSAPAFRPATRSESASVFHSLFDTDGDRGPLSPAVAELWGAPAARARAQDAAGLPALSTPGPVEDAGAPLDLQPAIRPTTRRLLGGGRI
jgi:hypothetical protein